MGNKFLSLKPKIDRHSAEAWEKWYQKENPGGYVGTFNDRIRNQILINLVRWSKRERGLDLACGEGSLTQALSPFIKSIKAFDISAGAIASAKKNYPAPNVEYFQQDMRDFSSNIGTFDFILCAEAIYHLEPSEIENVLIEIEKSLEQGGYFILTTRTDFWFGLNEFIEVFQKYFTIITIIPVWRPESAFYRAIKRLFSFFSPALDRVYRSWILGIDPTKPGMCAYVAIKK